MNLQDLKYFQHLAESLNFTHTADFFFVSQPSISMALKRLETELDAVLMDRRKSLKKMQLTPAGQILYQNTKQIMQILDETTQEIADLEQGTVYFGFLPTIGGHFLPKILPELSRFTKALKFIEEESSDVMLKMIQKEQAPIAILGHDTPYIMDNRIKQILLLEEEMALWVSPDSPLAEKEIVRAKDLRDEVFISLSEGYTHQRIFRKWAEHNHIQEPNIVYAKEIKTVQSIAASTRMIAYMSDILVSERTDLVKVRLENAPRFYISLVLNSEAERSHNQQQFHEAILEVVRRHLDDKKEVRT